MITQQGPTSQHLVSHELRHISLLLPGDCCCCSSRCTICLRLLGLLLLPCVVRLPVLLLLISLPLSTDLLVGLQDFIVSCILQTACTHSVRRQVDCSAHNGRWWCIPVRRRQAKCRKLSKSGDTRCARASLLTKLALGPCWDCMSCRCCHSSFIPASVPCEASIVRLLLHLHLRLSLTPLLLQRR